MVGLLYAGKHRISNQIVIGFVASEDEPDYKSLSHWVDGIREIFSKCSEIYYIRVSDYDSSLAEIKKLFPNVVPEQ